MLAREGGCYGECVVTYPLLLATSQWQCLGGKVLKAMCWRQYIDGSVSMPVCQWQYVDDPMLITVS